MKVALAEPALAKTRTRIRPGRNLWLAVLACLLASWQAPARLQTLLWLDLVLLAGLAFDVVRLLRARLSVQREVVSRLSVGTRAQVTIAIDNASSLKLRVRVRDEFPHAFEAAPLAPTIVAARAQKALVYEARALRRGLTQFGALHTRLESMLGLAALDRTHEGAADVRVMPYRAAQRTGSQAGPRDEIGEVRRKLLRAPQSAGELESLREYVAGDPLRSIDWKATAKRRHPVTRVYQPERSQTLWLVLDASRSMASGIGELDGIVRTRFDVAIETALSLSQVALRAGDQVGVIVFAQRCLQLLSPGRGRSQHRQIADLLSDADALAMPLDVRGLVALLERQARKRALLVILTDLDDEIHAGALAEHAKLLSRRHLSMIVSLDDAHVRALGEAQVTEEREVYDKAAALGLLEERAALRALLEKLSIGIVEADERGLAHAAMDRYLEAKTHNRL
jgi:uncharacterized protein (DUF58 family)